MNHSRLEGKFPGPEAEKCRFVCIFGPGASPIPEAFGPASQIPEALILLLSFARSKVAPSHRMEMKRESAERYKLGARGTGVS